ncbi:hypothetical protein AVEN_57214-1 [Araneus ventricosus]|uniref:Uncharacterized protein n=1 Tax=Araneus ventricosus TaxID=182803 RepID=A0A4Y2T5U3_ARAVE|nr:hypothetical protein AVEN_57214-1 [Araneus ventricosus]
MITRFIQWMIKCMRMISFRTYTADFQLLMLEKATQIFSMLRISLHKYHKKNRVPLPHQQCHQLMSRLISDHRQMFSRSDEESSSSKKPESNSKTFRKYRTSTKDIRSLRREELWCLSKKDYEVLSLSELNEFENWATGLGGKVDYLDLHTSDDVGDVSCKFRQDEYRQSEQVSLHLTENETYFSIMRTSNENVIFNISSDQRLSILQHGNSLDGLPSDCLIDVQPKASVIKKGRNSLLLGYIRYFRTGIRI